MAGQDADPLQILLGAKNSYMSLPGNPEHNCL
jgi:hypothetical protein